MNAIPFRLVMALTAVPWVCMDAQSASPSFESAPAVVVRTLPMAGSVNVDPTLTQLSVTFSKSMQDGSWSWSTWGEENFPKTTGQPKYQTDSRTCVLPVKLEPDRFYALWLNSETFRNFKDLHGTPAIPYLLTFRTGGGTVVADSPAVEPPIASIDAEKLNADQRTVLEWTERQFRGFLDGRTFEGWKERDRRDLETRSLDAVKGPINREYYQAINSLAALRSTNALPELRRIGLERREKDNRDRWMSIRALGMMGDTASVPELIHLVYHGNANTRWWAQISLVRITGQNFGSDWQGWGRWWAAQGGQPPFQSAVVRWWSGQAEESQLSAVLAESDAKFLEGLRR